MARELQTGDKIVSYFFFAERKGEIVGFEKNRHNEVLERVGMKLKDLVCVKWEDTDTVEKIEIDQIRTEKKGGWSWNGHGIFLEGVM